MTGTTHTYRAYLIALPDDVEMPVRGGSIRLDAASAAHVTASLTVSAPGVWEFVAVGYPEDALMGYGEGAYGAGGYGGYGSEAVWTADEEALEALDPRLNARVRIDVESVTTFGTVSRSFDLGLRSRSITHRPAEIALELASDEALLSDWAPLADDVTPLVLSGSLRSMVDYVLGEAIPGAALEVSPAVDYDLTTDADPEAFTWRAGQSALDFLHTLVQVPGFRLVCDEQRQWTLRDADYEAAGAASVRHAVNMTDADESISRDSGLWFDAAATRYTWTDGAGLEQVQVDAYALATPYTRLMLFEREHPYPGAGFSEYAVERAQQRGREINARAVSDFTVSAEQPATIYLDDTPAQVGKTEAVTFDLTTDEMTLSARTQDTPEGAIDLLIGTIDSLVGTINGL